MRVVGLYLFFYILQTILVANVDHQNEKWPDQDIWYAITLWFLLLFSKLYLLKITYFPHQYRPIDAKNNLLSYLDNIHIHVYSSTISIFRKSMDQLSHQAKIRTKKQLFAKASIVLASHVDSLQLDILSKRDSVRYNLLTNFSIEVRDG